MAHAPVHGGGVPHRHGRRPVAQEDAVRIGVVGVVAVHAGRRHRLPLKPLPARSQPGSIRRISSP